MKQLFIFLFIMLMLLSCKTGKPLVINLPQLNSNDPIQDCPEEIIVDYMPTFGENSPRYCYVYKGVGRVVEDFDTVWVRKNCNPKITRAD